MAQNEKCDDISFQKCPPKKRFSYGSVTPEAWSSTTKTKADVTDPLNINEALHKRWLTRRIWFNVFLLNVGSFFLTMGIGTVSLLQSSINSEQGIGVVSLAIKNGFMIVGSILVPTIMLKLGCKSTLVWGNVLFILYIPANFYPSWFTLVPAAIFAGVGSTMQSVGFKVYLARLAHLYSGITGAKVDRVNSRLFVLFVMTVFTSVTLGNLSSSLILDAGSEAKVVYSEDRLRQCGVNYCNEELLEPPLRNQSVNGSVFEADVMRQQTMKVYILIGFCTLSGILSIVAFAFVDPLTKLGISSQAEDKYLSPLNIMRNLGKTMKEVMHVLFIPLAMVQAGLDAFGMADFTKAFITCSLGVEYMGYIIMCTGVMGVLSSFLMGWFNTKAMRCFPVVSATLLQMIALMALFYWRASSNVTTNLVSLIVIGVITAFGSGTCNFFTPVLVSVIFKDNLETAFAVVHFWSYVSSTFFLAWSNFVCVRTKLYTNLVLLAISFFSYIALEVLVYKNKVPKMRLNFQYKKIVNENQK